MANVLLLMSDEHNPLWSSPHGHPSAQTPNMAKLAENGVLFESAYCPSPLCMPSRSAFMAGRRVHEIQAYSNCGVNVDPSPLSYGAALARQGVRSAYIGKTDVYARGKNLGFSDMMRQVDRGLPGDTNHRRNPMTIRHGAANRAHGYGPKADARAPDLLRVDEAVKWLTESASRETKPWVLAVNISAPHFPQFAPQDLWDLYKDNGDLPKYGTEGASAQHPYARAIRAHFETEQFTEEQVRGLRRGYLACVTLVDRQLGRLMEALRDANLLSATNVIYTSDHGDMLGKFGMWWKCSLYEDSVRVPMIAAGPDFPHGKTVTTPVDLHDAQASFFASTGARQPEGWQGTPLQEIPIHDPGRVVFSEYHGHGAPGSSYMIRKGQWKYIHYTGAPRQLFDLQADPDELVNCAESRKDTADMLERHLRDICSPEDENRRAEEFIEAQFRTIESAPH